MKREKKTSESITPIIPTSGIKAHNKTFTDDDASGKHDAIQQTLAADKITPNGFLPEHIRKVLRDAITKTD